MQADQSFLHAFVVPAKRQRYIELLASKRGRERILSTLDHFRDLDPRFCHRVPPSQHSHGGLLQILIGLGAPSACHVMSSDSNLDDREMGLSEALAEVIGRGMGTFISCLPGKLAYFEGEERNERYICHREK